jgi:hypothetical protein
MVRYCEQRRLVSPWSLLSIRWYYSYVGFYIRGLLHKYFLSRVETGVESVLIEHMTPATFLDVFFLFAKFFFTRRLQKLPHG